MAKNNNTGNHLDNPLDIFAEKEQMKQQIDQVVNAAERQFKALQFERNPLSVKNNTAESYADTHIQNIMQYSESVGSMSDQNKTLQLRELGNAIEDLIKVTNRGIEKKIGILTKEFNEKGTTESRKQQINEEITKLRENAEAQKKYILEQKQYNGVSYGELQKALNEIISISEDSTTSTYDTKIQEEERKIQAGIHRIQSQEKSARQTAQTQGIDKTANSLMSSVQELEAEVYRMSEGGEKKLKEVPRGKILASKPKSVPRKARYSPKRAEGTFDIALDAIGETAEEIKKSRQQLRQSLLQGADGTSKFVNIHDFEQQIKELEKEVFSYDTEATDKYVDSAYAVTVGMYGKKADGTILRLSKFLDYGDKGLNAKLIAQAANIRQNGQLIDSSIQLRKKLMGSGIGMTRLSNYQDVKIEDIDNVYDKIELDMINQEQFIDLIESLGDQARYVSYNGENFDNPLFKKWFKYNAEFADKANQVFEKTLGNIGGRSTDLYQTINNSGLSDLIKLNNKPGDGRTLKGLNTQQSWLKLFTGSEDIGAHGELADAQTTMLLKRIMEDTNFLNAFKDVLLRDINEAKLAIASAAGKSVEDFEKLPDGQGFYDTQGNLIKPLQNVIRDTFEKFKGIGNSKISDDAVARQTTAKTRGDKMVDAVLAQLIPRGASTSTSAQWMTGTGYRKHMKNNGTSVDHLTGEGARALGTASNALSELFVIAEKAGFTPISRVLANGSIELGFVPQGIDASAIDWDDAESEIMKGQIILTGDNGVLTNGQVNQGSLESIWDEVNQKYVTRLVTAETRQIMQATAMFRQWGDPSRAENILNKIKKGDMTWQEASDTFDKQIKQAINPLSRAPGMNESLFQELAQEMNKRVDSKTPKERIDTMTTSVTFQNFLMKAAQNERIISQINNFGRVHEQYGLEKFNKYSDNPAVYNALLDAFTHRALMKDSELQAYIKTLGDDSLEKFILQDSDFAFSWVLDAAEALGKINPDFTGQQDSQYRAGKFQTISSKVYTPMGTFGQASNRAVTASYNRSDVFTEEGKQERLKTSVLRTIGKFGWHNVKENFDAGANLSDRTFGVGEITQDDITKLTKDKDFIQKFLETSGLLEKAQAEMNDKGLSSLGDTQIYLDSVRGFQESLDDTLFMSQAMAKSLEVYEDGTSIEVAADEISQAFLQAYGIKYEQLLSEQEIDLSKKQDVELSTFSSQFAKGVRLAEGAKVKRLRRTQNGWKLDYDVPRTLGQSGKIIGAGDRMHANIIRNDDNGTFFELIKKKLGFSGKDVWGFKKQSAKNGEVPDYRTAFSWLQGRMEQIGYAAQQEQISPEDLYKKMIGIEGGLGTVLGRIFTVGQQSYLDENGQEQTRQILLDRTREFIDEQGNAYIGYLDEEGHKHKVFDDQKQAEIFLEALATSRMGNLLFGKDTWEDKYSGIQRISYNQHLVARYAKVFGTDYDDEIEKNGRVKYDPRLRRSMRVTSKIAAVATKADAQEALKLTEDLIGDENSKAEESRQILDTMTRSFESAVTNLVTYF